MEEKLELTKKEQKIKNKISVRAKDAILLLPIVAS
jgi:hypothetical protein